MSTKFVKDKWGHLTAITDLSGARKQPKSTARQRFNDMMKRAVEKMKL